MSVYAKFLDKNKSKLCESKSKKVSLKKLKRVNESDEIIDELKDFEPDIMENIYHKKQAFKDAAEYTAKSNGYVYYSTMYGHEQAICINVKGRPKINVDIPDDMYEIAQDYIDTFISDLADSLHEEDNDFVIYGRSGGYWGYENFEEYIVISDKGYKVLKDKVIELMKDEDKADWTIYDIVVNHLEELGDLLDASHLTLSKDFLEKLEDLSSIIDTNEKIIDDELKEMIENEGVNESCGKRKPKKPFPRKSLKESAKEDYQQLKDTLINSDNKWKVHKDKDETNYTFKTKKVEITIGTGDELEEKYGSPYVAFVTIKTPNQELEDTYVGDTLKKVKEKVLNNSLVSQYLTSDMKSIWKDHLKETFDDFKTHLIDAYSQLGGVITLGNAINKDLSDYPQEIQDFMSEIDLNKLKEIRDNMRPIVKGAAKTFYDTYGW